MTWEQFISQQERVMEDLRNEGRTFGRAVSTVHSEVVQRIFEEGKASDGDEIGQYSEKGPISIGDQYPSPGTYPSYKAYRAAIGRETAFVNLRLTGVLQADYANSLRSVNAQHWRAEIKNEENVKKAEANIDRFNKEIFALTEAEEDRLAEVFDFELNRELNG